MPSVCLSHIIWTILALSMICGRTIANLQTDHSSNGRHYGGSPSPYGRDFLLSRRSHSDISGLTLDIPPECIGSTSYTNGHNKRRKRGRKGGLRHRVRSRKFRPPLPTILLSNVRSIRNKLDELHANVKFLNEYRESCLLCFTETWLNPSINDQILSLPEFDTPIRLDRSADSTGKQVGGGLCIYVNSQWCKQYTIREELCTPNVELLSVSFRPKYLPREFGQVFVVLVYVPPSANDKVAAESIYNHIQKLESISADAPKLILGDFNSCTLKSTLPHYQQYVKCHTRNNKTIDLCYGNIKGAYTAVSKPPLGKSDHNTVQLLPSYRQKLKTGSKEMKSVKSWDTDSIETLQGCFECTEWDAFFGDNPDPDEVTDVITCYINFCIDSIIPTKNITIYPNNKPWITKELKHLLNAKKRAFCSGDRMKSKEVQRDIDNKTRLCREEYKDKVEDELRKHNSRTAWKGIQTMIGNDKPKKQAISSRDDAMFASDLNTFYARFDDTDHTAELQALLADMPDSDPQHSLTVNSADVEQLFNRVNPRKSTGPDGLPGVVIKKCSSQLSCIFTRLFQLSLDSHVVPKLWKVSRIIPVPKKTQAKELNDYRPIALTSIAMKCFERLVLQLLFQYINDKLDPLQFAYRSKRGVEDATLTILNKIYTHLEKPRAYVRILFVDFSSAFNTIQPHLLVKKLTSLDVSHSLIRWISNFLTQRTQYVCVNGTSSSSIMINTGAPQGCVLSPVLFTTYTNDCVSQHPDCSLVKFADDSSLVALLQDSDNIYHEEVEKLTDWCADNSLHLNVKKTKDMIIDFKCNKSPVNPVIINDSHVQTVSEYKYLGTIIDNRLTWNSNTDAVYKKCQQRLYFMRKLRSFNVNTEMLSLFYRCFVESVLTFGIQIWFASLSLQNRNKLSKIIHICEKIANSPFEPLPYIHERRVLSLADKILDDPSHALHNQYKILPSGRRYIVPLLKTNRSKKSFIPLSIILLNAKYK